MAIPYKEYEIETSLFKGKTTVTYEGDELVFDTINEAKAFIDSVSKGNENEKGV